jgi:sulfide:quinone oxidoreductase
MGAAALIASSPTPGKAPDATAAAKTRGHGLRLKPRRPARASAPDLQSARSVSSRTQTRAAVDVMRVLVAGGGIAALEVLAGLRKLAGDRVQATLLCPEGSFSYRPLSTAVPFRFRKERTRGLQELVGGLGATFVRDGLAQVDEARGRVLTNNGDFLPYDVLVLAVGARLAVPEGALTWRRGREGTAELTRLLHELEDGTARSAAFVVPPRAAWPVDAYELALVASLAAHRGASGAQVSIVTAEAAPLEAFGPAAGEAVSIELERADIQLITGVEATIPDERHEAGRDAFSAAVARLSNRVKDKKRRDGLVLRLGGRRPMGVDRALFVPAVRGPGVGGTAHDASGFVRVDEHARVLGQDGVYAVGDATALTLKHSTLASRQGTAAAEAIAAAAGANVHPEPWSPTLYGFLTLPPHFPSAAGSPWCDDGEPVTHCVWWPPGHVAGRHLAPYLASVDSGVRPGLDWHPNGVPVTVPVAEYAEADVTAPSAPTEAAVSRDARTRQLMAVRRVGREGQRLEHELERRLEAFERHEREVVAELRAAGYLRES